MVAGKVSPTSRSSGGIVAGTRDRSSNGGSRQNRTSANDTSEEEYDDLGGCFGGSELQRFRESLVPYLGPADERRAHDEAGLDDGELPSLSTTPKRVKAARRKSPQQMQTTLYSAGSSSRLDSDPLQRQKQRAFWSQLDEAPDDEQHQQQQQPQLKPLPPRPSEIEDSVDDITEPGRLTKRNGPKDVAEEDVDDINPLDNEFCKNMAESIANMGDICGEANKTTSPRRLKYDPAAEEEATAIEVEYVEPSDSEDDDDEETTSYSKQRSRAQETVSVVSDSYISSTQLTLTGKVIQKVTPTVDSSLHQPSNMDSNKSTKMNDYSQSNNSQEPMTNWTAAKKNAYLKDMARKAKKEHQKSMNTSTEVHEEDASTDGGDGDDDGNNESDEEDDDYADWSPAEKRKFLQLLSSGVSPAEGARMVRTERKATLGQTKKKAVVGEKQKESSGKKDPSSSSSSKKKRFAFWKSGDDKTGTKKKDKDQISSNNNKTSKKQNNDDEKVSESAAVSRSTTPETSSAMKRKSTEKTRAAAAATAAVAAAAIGTKKEPIKKPEMMRQESEPFDVVQDNQMRLKQGAASPGSASAVKSTARLVHSPSAAEDLLLETLTDEEDEPELVAAMDHQSEGLSSTVMAANKSPASSTRVTTNMSKQALVAASLAAAAKKSFKASSSRSIVVDVEPRETSSSSPSSDLDPTTPTYASRAMPMDESNEDDNDNSKPATPQPAGIVDSGSVYYDAVRRNIYDEDEEVPEQTSYSSLAINQRNKPKLSMPRFHNLEKERKESARATSTRSLGGSSRSLGGMNSRAQAQQSTSELAKPSGDEPMVTLQDGKKALSSKLRNGTAFLSLDSMSAVTPLHQRANAKKKKTKIDNISEVDDIALLKNDDLIQDPIEKDRDNKSVGAHSSSSAGSMSTALALLRNRNRWKKLDVDEQEDERHSLSDHSSRFIQTPTSSTSRALPPSQEDSSATKSENGSNRRAVAAASLGAAGIAAAVASSDNRSRPDAANPHVSPLEAREKENNAPNKENNEDEDSVFDLDGDGNDEVSLKSKALTPSPAAPALRKSINGFISPAKSNRVMFAVEDDSNLESELRRADGRKSASSPGDSMSVVSGMSTGRSVMTEGTSASSVYTTSSANTQSSRKRRPGAAKKRIAKAKEAELRNSKGWHESIREAAATNNRVWNPSKGWIDYEEPEAEETGLEDGRNEKLHISLNVSKRSPSNQDNSSDSVSKSPSTSVAFPSGWEKDRSEMIPIEENEDGDDHSADALNEEKKGEPLSPPRSPARARAAQGEADSPNKSWVESMRAATAKLNTGNRQWDPEQGWTESGPPVSEVVTLSPSRKSAEAQSHDYGDSGLLGIAQPSFNDVPISSVAEEADENSTQTSDQSSVLSASPRSMGVVGKETGNDVEKVVPSKEGLSDWIQASANLGGSQPESSMTEIESDGAVASIPSKSSALPTNKVPKGSRNRLLPPPGVGAKSRTPKAGDQRDSSITSSKKSGASAGYVELSSNGSVRSIAEEMRSISDPSVDDGTTATNESRSLAPVSVNSADFSAAVTERQSFNLSNRGVGLASGKAPTVHVVKEKMSKSDRDLFASDDGDIFASNDDGTRGGTDAKVVLKDSKSTDDDSRNSDTWDNSGFGDDNSDSEIVKSTTQSDQFGFRISKRLPAFGQKERDKQSSRSTKVQSSNAVGQPESTSQIENSQGEVKKASPTVVEPAEGNKKEVTKKATREKRLEQPSPTRSVSSLAQQWEAKANAKKEKASTEKNSEPVFVASGDDDSVFKFQDRSKIPKDDDDSIFMFSDVGSPLRLDQASLAKHEARTKIKEEPPVDNFGFPDAVENDMYLDTLAAALSKNKQAQKDPKADHSRSLYSRGDPDGRLGADVDDRGSDFTKGSTIEKATFFSRLQACAAPIIPRFNTENPPEDSLSAHLAFLKRSPNNNPSPSSNSARSFPSPAFVCGRPDTVFEEGDDETETNNDESTRQSYPSPPRTRSRPRSNQRASQSSSSPHVSPKRDRGPNPNVGQSNKSISSNSEMKSPSSDISGGGGFGAKTAYLEALALKTAVSNKKKEDAKRNATSRKNGAEEDGLSDTGNSPSVVSSATEQSHSQAWQSFLERKKSNSGRKTGSSAKSSSDNDVSRAAEKYATEKVEEMMANMPSPSESNRTNPKFQEYGGGQSSNRSDSGSSMMDSVSRGRTKKKSSSAKAAEDLAAARVEAMMMAMSSTKLDEGGM